MSKNEQLYSFPCELPAVVSGTYGGNLMTTHVGRNGAYIRTTSPAPIGELLTIAFSIPNGNTLEALAYVKHVVNEAKQDVCPGMGVMFFSMDRKAKGIWEAFVNNQASQASVGASDGTKVSCNAPTLRERVREFSEHLPPRRPRQQAAARYRTSMEVQFLDVKMLIRLIKSEIMKGLMFVATPEEILTGSGVELSLVHPITDTSFKLIGVVKKQQTDEMGSFVGVLVQLDPIPDAKKRDLVRFSLTGQVCSQG